MARLVTYENTKDDYTALLMRVQIKPGWMGAYTRAADYIIANRARYEAVSRRMGGIPWELIGCLHWREASGSFTGVLHNGERILGTGRKTRLEPKGRGPFNTWEEAAVDAIRIKSKVTPPQWDLTGVAWFAENFNGLGYRRYYPHVKSPYLWAGTNVYAEGKYTSDGHFDGSHVDKQLGVMPLYQMVQDRVRPVIVRENSRKSGIISKARTTIKAVGTTVAGWFTLDSLGVIKEWASFATGLVDGKTLLVLVLAGGGTWAVLQVLDGLIVQDAEASRYDPSKSVASDEGPLNGDSYDELPA